MLPGTFFETILSVPQSSSKETLGSSNEYPIPLCGINGISLTAKDFRSFLVVIHSNGNTPAMIAEDWISVLRLSVLWRFNKIHETAMNILSTRILFMKWTEKLKLANEFGVAEWRRDAYIDLVQKRRLTLDELTELGESQLNWETIAKIFYIREMLDCPPGCANAPIRSQNEAATPSFPNEARQLVDQYLLKVDVRNI
ncbi:hypothetical protein JR316_0002651 [Psilocybe cubensis]|uniref:Uncharacterized protein n=2 Tax=Psilocybe cubensis TaxID=181762 RepID=A0ACB8HCU2_PSICU|nr:hypothetical protein JR316_0002651 [Psilocybe cubensis]KAH9485736.1 hypothetical protein JR316_0002651 [Psilocybe cubensis]